VACPAGFYKDFAGSRLGTVADCLPCTGVPSVYSNAGSAVCLPCPANTEVFSKNPSDRNSMNDCRSRIDSLGSDLVCLGGHGNLLPQSPITGGMMPPSAAYRLRLDSVMCDPADNTADGWTSVFSSVRTAVSSCAITDGEVTLNRELDIPEMENRMIQLTWRTGQVAGGMLITFNDRFTTYTAGCTSVTACQLQIRENGQAHSPAVSVLLNSSHSYVLTLFARPAPFTMELRLFSVDAVSGDFRLIGSLAPLAPSDWSFLWSQVQYGFVNNAGGQSCAQRYEIYSICRSNERVVNGACFGKCACV
jgi:hypothetical protein